MIYFNNASTSFPKPQAVTDKVTELLTSPAMASVVDPHGHYRDFVMATRQKFARFFNVPQPESIIFTSNSTESLNSIIEGVLTTGDHVVATAAEHNSVIRPLMRLQKERQITVHWIPVNQYGVADPAAIIAAVTDATRLVIVNHASNVTGGVQDIVTVGQALLDHPNTYFAVDASQTAGRVVIDNATVHADFIAFTGHKSLFGISGTGGYYINPLLTMRPARVGGTGIRSAEIDQPAGLPIHYETGMLNTVGIASLFYALDYLADKNVSHIGEQLVAQTGRIIAALSQYPGVTCHSQPNPIGVISFSLVGAAPEAVTQFLAETADISTRAGLMCAPFIHHYLGTAPAGCVRASLSQLTTDDEITVFLSTIQKFITQEK